jgi:hypothetical protein
MPLFCANGVSDVQNMPWPPLLYTRSLLIYPGDAGIRILSYQTTWLHVSADGNFHTYAQFHNAVKVHSYRRYTYGNKWVCVYQDCISIGRSGDTPVCTASYPRGSLSRLLIHIISSHFFGSGFISVPCAISVACFTTFSTYKLLLCGLTILQVCPGSRKCDELCSASENIDSRAYKKSALTQHTGTAETYI